MITPKNASDSTLEPPSKRRREAGLEDAPIDVVKSTRFWFCDGTVVMQADNIQFRIHWGVLATRSDVFKDMFATPQPPGEPTIEGCRLVHVHDTAEDWEVLLDVLYCSGPAVPDADRGFAYYTSILRLGKKYAFTNFADTALKNLSMRLSRIPVANPGQIPGLTKPAMYKLVHVVEELGIQILLPKLYFISLLMFPLIEISDGFTSESGTPISFPPNFRRMVLTRRDEFIRILRLQWNWLNEPQREHPWLQNAPRHANIPALFCVTSQECLQACKNKVEGIERISDLSVIATFHVIQGLCPGCSSEVYNTGARRFNYLFDLEMMRLFDLPPLQELVPFAK